MKPIIAALSLGACVAGFAISAYATEPGEALDGARPVIVKFSDLDLASPAGRATLQHRVAAGAAAFCGPRPFLRDLDRQARFQACLHEAQDRTMAALDQALAKNAAGHHETAAPSETVAGQ